MSNHTSLPAQLQLPLEPTAYFPRDIENYAPWVVEFGLVAPYGVCQCGCGEKTSLAARNRYERGNAKGEPVRFVAWHGIGSDPDPVPVFKEGEYAPWVEKHGLQYEYGKCQCGCGQDTPLATRNEYQSGHTKGQPIQFIHWHHTRLRRTPPIEEHFWAQVKILGPDDCWEWRGHRSRKGYGQLWFIDQTIAAHRVAWILTHGTIPDGLWVLHKCDNPPCTNINHLFLGTNDDNVADKITKNRQAHGVNHPHAKLTEEQVIEARQRFAKGGISMAALAREYSVSGVSMRCVLLRATWQHLP